MKNNKKGFSLILAMGIVIIISLIAYNILDYIIPFGKNVKGVENSSKSYYLANSGIEEGLYHINNRSDEVKESGQPFSGDTSYNYNTFSSGGRLPPNLEGNSYYNNGWNTIFQGNPIQLSIGNNYINDLANFSIAFRVPNLDLDGGTTETISGAINTPYTPIVNWQLSSLNNTLNASGGLITNNDILDSDELFTSTKTIELASVAGVDLNGIDDINLGEFYGNSLGGNCFGISSGCILKFSVINKLELTLDSTPIPYLEWQIQLNDNGATNNIPLRYTKIESSGKSIGYKKELEIKVPTKTVNQAFDFTVFQ